jgi:nitrogen fixation NifU-like protein
VSDLRDLYQELILEHARSPRNYRVIEGARHVEGYNPLCGDHFTVWVDVDADGRVLRDVSFQGQGCAISTASASVMTELVKGRSPDDIEGLTSRFHDLVTGRLPGDPDELGKLAVFAGVSEYPARVKCASLAWHALSSALQGAEAPVTTE